MDKRTDNIKHLKKLRERLELKIINAERTCKEKSKKLATNFLIEFLFLIIILAIGNITTMFNISSKLILMFFLLDAGYLIFNISLFADYKRDSSFYKKYLEMQDIITKDIDDMENSLNLNNIKEIEVSKIDNYKYSYDPTHKLGICDASQEEKIEKVYRKTK